MTCVYNLVLSSGHVVSINGCDFITLGHGIAGHPVLSHAFFGTQAVVRAVSARPSASGVVVIPNGFRRRAAPPNSIFHTRRTHATTETRSLVSCVASPTTPPACALRRSSSSSSSSSSSLPRNAFDCRLVACVVLCSPSRKRCPLYYTCSLVYGMSYYNNTGGPFCRRDSICPERFHFCLVEVCSKKRHVTTSSTQEHETECRFNPS